MTGSLFVAFEGGEGAGKSTQVNLLAERVRKAGREVVVTREPGGTPVAESIRAFILDSEHTEMASRTEALLFAAARSEHVIRVIEPALSRGDVVLCDRFVDSSIAYQGAGRRLGAHEVQEVNSWATEGLVPDITIVLDIDPRAGLTRAKSVADPDRLESLDLEFHDDVRDAFLELASVGGSRYVVIDADQDPTVVCEAIWEVIAPHLS